MLHEIKIEKTYADAITEGRKNFEVRINDRGYNAGDNVHFNVIAKTGTVSGWVYIDHKLNEEVYKITYVHSGLGLKEDYVVFGIEKTDMKPRGRIIEVDR